MARRKHGPVNDSICLCPEEMDYSDLDEFALRDHVGVLNGCTLELWGLVDHHHEKEYLVFRVTGLGCGFGRLLLRDIQELDCPTVMHDVRLTLPTMEDFLTWGDSRPTMDFWKLVVECAEGNFHISALQMSICWTDDPNVGLSVNGEDVGHRYAVATPLWIGGPDVSEL